MRREYPDYRTPIVAYFRALGVWTLVLVGVATLLLIFKASPWLDAGLFITLTAAGLAISVVLVRRAVGDEQRARRGTDAEARAASPVAPPSRSDVIARLVVRTWVLMGLLLLVVGLVAHVTGLAVAGAVLFGLFLTALGFALPVLKLRSSKRRPE